MSVDGRRIVLHIGADTVDGTEQGGDMCVGVAPVTEDSA